MTKPLPIEKLTSPYKCPMHRMWMKKGQCEMCRLTADKKQKELEATIGSHKPEIKITKL